jgi:hypothetical protein
MENGCWRIALTGEWRGGGGEKWDSGKSAGLRRCGMVEKLMGPRVHPIGVWFRWGRDGGGGRRGARSGGKNGGGREVALRALG